MGQSIDPCRFSRLLLEMKKNTNLNHDICAFKQNNVLGCLQVQYRYMVFGESNVLL